MLRQLIDGCHYQVHGSGKARQFIAHVHENKVTLTDVLDGVIQDSSRPVDLSDDDWKTIDFVGEPPLIADRAYLVRVNGKWATSLWSVSNTRVDMPTQYCFSSLSVPFGAGVEKTILVPLPEESDDWIDPAFALPANGAEVIHWDKASPQPRISKYERYQSFRHQGLNMPCFGVDNPPDCVKAWMPLRNLTR